MRERVEEALREAAAEFLSREAGRQSLVTVTRAQLNQKGTSATILVTVMPESAEEAFLGFANRNRDEFKNYFESRVRGTRAPYVTFAIDRGEKNRQRLDELTS